MNYREFKVGDLFDIHPTKTKKVCGEAGSTPLLSNTSENNGISKYVKESATEKGGIITFSDTTESAKTVFYQPEDFIGFSHVQGMYPYEKQKWTKNVCLYFIKAFQISIGTRFDYATKFNRSIAKNMMVLLPVTDTGEIDFEYMEHFMKELSKECTIDIEQFLTNKNIDSFDLTKEDVCFLHKTINYKEYKIGDLFEIKSSKKKFNACDVKITDKGYPYVVRKSTNNGIRGYIEEDSSFLNDGKTISFGQDTATMFYQEHPYFTGDRIKILKLKGRILDELTAQFFLTSMRKAFNNFTWGVSSFEEDIIKNVIIYLPITNSGEIDFEYMKQYMEIQEKQILKEINNYKNKIIA